jgi:hypothetical protein
MTGSASAPVTTVFKLLESMPVGSPTLPRSVVCGKGFAHKKVSVPVSQFGDSSRGSIILLERVRLGSRYH